jgi:transposase InsO family protein
MAFRRRTTAEGLTHHSDRGVQYASNDYTDLLKAPRCPDQHEPARQPLRQRVRDLIRDICAQHEVKIMKGHVAKDHVHLFVSIPPQVTISRLLQWLKGKTAHHI